jgi:hypothetical protein
MPDEPFASTRPFGSRMESDGALRRSKRDITFVSTRIAGRLASDRGTPVGRSVHLSEQ